MYHVYHVLRSPCLLTDSIYCTVRPAPVAVLDSLMSSIHPLLERPKEHLNHRSQLLDIALLRRNNLVSNLCAHPASANDRTTPIVRRMNLSIPYSVRKQPSDIRIPIHIITINTTVRHYDRIYAAAGHKQLGTAKPSQA